ncbi:Hypothetical predicted protein [Lecanosticta acicola]|uniref:Uncharacterized protein n=1 Tax=Lecanosticta acicola TaxID=111012 RepID=A0AAI9ECF5_9PEZI|nr:Hypothetical predicted protein [Lecanosticta acicola]
MSLTRLLAKVRKSLRRKEHGSAVGERQLQCHSMEHAPRVSAFSFEEDDGTDSANVEELLYSAQPHAFNPSVDASTAHQAQYPPVSFARFSGIQPDTYSEEERIASTGRHSLRFPTFGGASSQETLPELSISAGLSKAAARLEHPALIEKIPQGCVQSHHAIKDTPPPFVRHSAPERHHKGPMKQAQIIEQDRRELQEACLAKDTELECLSQRLEQVCQELDTTQGSLEKAVEQLVVREQQCSRMRDEQNALMTEKRVAVDAFAAKHHELEALRETHAISNKKHDRRVRSLLKCRAKKKRELKLRIGDLEQELFTTQRQLRESELSIAQRDHTHVEIARLRQTEAELVAADEQLDARQRQVEALQEEREAELEELKLAQSEAYSLTQKLRSTERTLKDREVALEASKQNNKDLILEIRCLKQRVAEAQSHRLTV